MNDPRIQRLAEILIDHSCQLKSGEKLLIEAIDLPEPDLVCRLIELAAARGAHPLVSWKSNTVLRSLYATGTEVNLALAGDVERYRMEQVQAYIGIRGTANSSQFADVPLAKMDLYQQHWWHPVHSKVRVPKTRWVVLRYPTHGMAQSANMSTQAFEDYYFSVCTADYEQMARDQQPLVARMEAADRVRIVAPGTDLEFSIHGVIRYNTRSLYQGTVFEGIEFEFRDGRIVRATCSNEPAKLNQVLDADEGARYIGEWSIGCNNRVKRPMLDTLFDEKIGGSIHLTPGQAYEECDNGNRSRVHWDLVLIQTPAYGGGEIWFDGELLRQDGRFVPADLQGLNAGLE